MNFTFFSSAHGTVYRIDHILGHKSSLGKYKKTEIIPSIFYDRNAVFFISFSLPYYTFQSSKEILFGFFLLLFLSLLYL